MDYLSQLEKAILFVEDHLREDIKVEEVAATAGYSYFHFHRIFEAVVGESVGNYLRTRRLNRGAHDLIYSSKRIIDIAMEYRFESQEAFTRAFKKIYKVTPGAYRRNRLDVIIGNHRQLTPSSLAHLVKGVTLEPRIVDFPGAMIVGMRGTTTINENRIPALWQEFNPRVSEIRNLTPSIRGYGICEVDPDYDMTKFNADTVFSEFVGAEVTDFPEIPPGMAGKTLHGGRYAVFTHKGSMDKLAVTYDYIWSTWIIYSGYELDLRDDFEFYDERFRGQDHEQSELDIYVPIK